MALPQKLGNTHNLATWKKLKHKKDEKLGDYLREIDIYLDKCAHGTNENVVNALITACERAATSAQRVSNQLKLPEVVEEFCKKIQYATEGIRKDAIEMLTRFERGNVENNRKMKKCIDDVSEHEKRVNEANLKINMLEKSSERLLGILIDSVTSMKKLIGSVNSDGTSSTLPQSRYNLIIDEYYEPIQANAAQAKTIYETIEPIQAKYRGKPQGIIETVGLTDPTSVEKVKKIINTAWARVNKTAIAYDTSYKHINAMLGEASSCKSIAKKHLAAHQAESYDQKTAQQGKVREAEKNLKFLQKATATIQKLHDIIHEKCFVKSDFEADYLKQTKDAVASHGRNITYEILNARLIQNKNYQTILSTKLIDARKHIAESRKAQKLVVSNIEITKDTPEVIKKALGDFTQVFVSITQQERGLLTKENNAMPALATSIEFLKKAMTKVKK